MTLDQIVHIWTNGRSPITVKIYEGNAYALEKSAQSIFNKSLLAVSAAELEELMRIKHCNSSLVTKNAQTWIVKGFFRTVQKFGIRPDNPAEALRPPKFPDRLADRLLTREQVEHFLSCAKGERNRLLILVLYGAGLRISEALNLRKRDILGNGMIRVWGKGQKTDYVRIQPELESLLLKFTDTRRPEDFVFQGYHGALSRKSAHGVIKRIAARAGMPQVSAHFFRHSHATHALKGGASLPTVKQSLRHADIQTTMRYVHVLPQDGAANYLPPLPI